MVLECILLGLLAKPASGYDLKREFDTAINHFWYADIAQVYRTLQRMEESGLLKSKEVESGQGPSRRVYRRTAAGRRKLFAWLRDEPVIGPQRYEYVAQVVFLGQLGDCDETLRFLAQTRSQLTSRLAVLKHIADSEPEPDLHKVSDPDFHAFLGLNLGIQTTQSRIQWCDEAIALVQQRQRIAERSHAHD